MQVTTISWTKARIRARQNGFIVEDDRIVNPADNTVFWKEDFGIEFYDTAESDLADIKPWMIEVTQ